eukprot:TRINITY_DN135606_c0_g1_i1.p1 TRINITY_DN135606_c0_g1~~TRINITY_DN135606_c0_g1_i1.p1  ORF type:complete len:599 (-),score=71.19 TRINITY_DN135606_c0_g1_i1:2324-4120(-)
MLLEEEKQMQDKRIQETCNLKELLKAKAAEHVTQEQKDIYQFYTSQIGQYKKIDLKKEVEKLHTERRAQEEKAARQIVELQNKLNEARAQLLESQKAFPQENHFVPPPSSEDKAKDNKIAELTKKLKDTQRELESTRQDLSTTLEEKREMAVEISESQKRMADLQKEKADLLAKLAEASKHPVEEEKVPLQVEAHREPEPRFNYSLALAQSLPIESADLVSGAGPESSKTGEENVGDEARGAAEEENRREDLSAESGSTALIEQRMKNGQKEGRYEEQTNEIQEEPYESEERPQKEESGVPNIENAGDGENQRDFFDGLLPIEEEIKEARPLVQPFAEINSGQSPLGDPDAFFDNIVQQQQERNIAPIPQPAVVPQPPQTVPPVPKSSSKKKVDVVPDDLFQPLPSFILICVILYYTYAMQYYQHIFKSKISCTLLFCTPYYYQYSSIPEFKRVTFSEVRLRRYYFLFFEIISVAVQGRYWFFATFSIGSTTTLAKSWSYGQACTSTFLVKLLQIVAVCIKFSNKRHPILLYILHTNSIIQDTRCRNSEVLQIFLNVFLYIFFVICRMSYFLQFLSSFIFAYFQFMIAFHVFLTVFFL